MVQSAEAEGPVMVIVDGDPSDLKIPRRRMVQSTLFPHRSSEITQKCDNAPKKEGDDEEIYSSQEKKTRKRKAKTTQQKVAPKKAKTPTKRTPKKNAKINLQASAKRVTNKVLHPAAYNLRLEAKLSEQEHSRMYAGKQIHPFFTSIKAKKRCQEGAEIESSCAPVERKDKRIDIGPIHVFERIQENNAPIDWSNWTFCEEPTILLDQCLSQQENSYKMSLPIPDISDDKHTEQCQVFDQLACEVDEVAFMSGNRAAVFNSSIEQKGVHIQKSNQQDDGLWTDKYQPRKAKEVCGNTESVQVIKDWLHRWNKGGSESIKNSTGGEKHHLQDNDYNCNESDSDSENEHNDASLKNVLCITGPVGSGKSAAIRACAKEQGFEILESNASECRNGVAVKQIFGTALELRRITRSSGTTGTCEEVVYNESRTRIGLAKVQPLILFEDVDIVFPEDRGFVAAIQQIAERAKGPVILTSNKNNPGLPVSIDRLKLCFGTPSEDELFNYLCTVCKAEKVIIQPHLLKQLVGYYQGDIRKTMTHLQFWYRSQRYRKERNVQNSCNPLLFIPEVCHKISPSLIPWDLPSQVSELVENEISKSLSLIEETSNLMEVVVEEADDEGLLNQMRVPYTEQSRIKSKKQAMLKMNCSLDEIENLYDTCEVPNSSVKFDYLSQRDSRRNLNFVVSSDSEDEILKDSSNSMIDKSLSFEAEKEEGNCFSSEEANVSYSIETCKTVDLSCVPESTFVPETEIDNEEGLSFGGAVEVSVGVDFSKYPSAVEAQNKGSHVNISHRILHGEANIELSYGDVADDSNDQHWAGLSRHIQVMDECSRVDFSGRSKTAERNRFDVVQESWKRLRHSHSGLKQCLASEPEDASRIVELTYRMSNAIAEADVLLSRFQDFESLEVAANWSDDTDVLSRDNELFQMASTFSSRSFSYYSKEIAASGSNLGTRTHVDLSQDMLASTTNMTRVGVSVLPEVGVSNNTSTDGNYLAMNPDKSEDLLHSKRKLCLYNTIKQLVHPRLSFVLKGDAFHEYVSSLGLISRLDTHRLSQDINSTKKRRSRRGRHYLSIGPPYLSPEDISFLGQHSKFGKQTGDTAETQA